MPKSVILILTGGLLVFAALAIAQRRRARRVAAKWVERPAMPDAELLLACGIGTDRFPVRVALAARRAIAKLATVPPETILPDDSFARDLNRLPFWDSLDWLGFDFEVERELGDEVKVRHGEWQRELKGTGVTWRNLLVRHVVKAVAATASPLGRRQPGGV